MLKNLNIKWKKLHPEAQIPKYQNKGDAGFDFHVVLPQYKDDLPDDSDGISFECNNSEEISQIQIHPNGRFIASTGLACEFDLGWQMEIRPRSGLARRHSLTIPNSPATVDSGYRGEILIILHNMGQDIVVINNYDRVAQGVMMPAPQFQMVEVDELSSENDRGGGFGSTGS